MSYAIVRTLLIPFRRSLQLPSLACELYTTVQVVSTAEISIIPAEPVFKTTNKNCICIAERGRRSSVQARTRQATFQPRTMGCS
jgi:hypothetical protein